MWGGTRASGSARGLEPLCTFLFGGTYLSHDTRDARLHAPGAPEGSEI
jgi:hypothetical protein